MNKTDRKLVYIASPVRAILERIMYLDDAYRVVTETAKEAAKIVKAAGHIPVSPVLMWFGVFDDYKDRNELIANCRTLLKLCDEIYVSTSKYSKFSVGIKQELVWAKEFGIPQVQYKEEQDEK
jgi:hypothetical protein